MFNDTLQYAQVGVKVFGGAYAPPPEAGVSEVELSPFSGLKPLWWRVACTSKTGSTHLARLHGVRPEDRNVCTAIEIKS